MGLRLDPLDVRPVYDGAAMHSHELVPQPLLERVHGFADQVPSLLRVQLSVIALGVDPFDIRERNRTVAADAADDEAVDRRLAHCWQRPPSRQCQTEMN